MSVSVRRSLVNIVISLILAVAVIYVMAFMVDELASVYPFLKTYEVYIKDAVAAVIAVGISLVVVRVVKHLMDSLSTRTEGRRNLRGFYIIIRVIIYATAITWFLSYIGVNIEGALVGGAIGGIVIGFAVQSVVSNLLSGLMVSGGGFLVPGEPVSIYSWMFGPNVIGLVDDVKTLYTRIKTPSGQSYLLPNTALLGSSVFTPLKDGKSIRYSLTITLPGDVPAEPILNKARERIDHEMDKRGIESLDLYLSSKNGTTNSFLAVIVFRDMMDLNRIIDFVNMSMDSSYWEIRNAK